jgi:hypothetical protein
METPRRSVVGNGSANTGTSRFPGIGGAPPSGSLRFEASPPAAAARTGVARTDDEVHYERWKETVRAQDEDQALLHQTVVASKRQQLDVQHERVRP